MADNSNLKARYMLPEKLVAGRSIRIRGFIPEYSNRFHLNLLHGSDDEIALQFDVRFQEGKVIMNHYVQGKDWGSQETDGEVPFKRNAKFEVIFTIEQKGIRVTANGVPFTTFNHRLPFTGINILRIHQDVDITLIAFEEGF